MALGIFLIGEDSIEDVRAIRNAAIESLKDGKTVMEWVSELTTVRKVFAMSIKDTLIECNDFLKRADPATYGKKVTRTRAGFNTAF